MTGPVRGDALVGAARAGALVAAAETGVAAGSTLVGAGFSAWLSTTRVGARVAVGGGSVGAAARRVGAVVGAGTLALVELAALRDVVAGRAGPAPDELERAAVVGRADGTVGLVAMVGTGSGLPRMTASSVASGVGCGGGISPASATRLVPPQALRRNASVTSDPSAHRTRARRSSCTLRGRRLGRGAATGMGLGQPTTRDQDVGCPDHRQHPVPPSRAGRQGQVTSLLRGLGRDAQPLADLQLVRIRPDHVLVRVVDGLPLGGVAVELFRNRQQRVAGLHLVGLLAGRE